MSDNLPPLEDITTDSTQTPEPRPEDNPTIDRIKERLREAERQREVGDEGGLGDADPEAHVDNPDIDSLIDDVIEETSESLEREGKDPGPALKGLPVTKRKNDPEVFTKLSRVMASKNEEKWREKLAEFTLKASGRQDAFNAAAPNKRIQGQLGRRVEIPALNQVLLILDASASMGEGKFKKVIKEIESMATIWPYSEMLRGSQVHLVKWSSNYYSHKRIDGDDLEGGLLAKFATMGPVRGGSDAATRWLQMSQDPSIPKRIDLCVNMGDGDYSRAMGPKLQKLKAWWSATGLDHKTVYVFPGPAQDARGLLRALSGPGWGEYAVEFR